jgi:hypothetical protein
VSPSPSPPSSSSSSSRLECADSFPPPSLLAINRRRVPPLPPTHPAPLSRQKQNLDHLKTKIKKVNASVDNKGTTPPKHLVVNAKKAQLEEDRLLEIESRNKLLLHHLHKIAERKGVEGYEKSPKKKSLLRGQAPDKPNTKSLNAIKRREEMLRIERENALILKRIQSQNHKQSEFSVARMEKEWKETLEHRKYASQWVKPPE